MIHARGFGGMLPKMIFEMIDAINLCFDAYFDQDFVFKKYHY